MKPGAGRLSRPVRTRCARSHAMCAAAAASRPHQGRQDPLYRGHRNHPVNRGVLCAKARPASGSICARPPARAAEGVGPRARASSRTSPGTRRCRGTEWLGKVRATTRKSSPSSPARPVAIPDRLLGAAVRHANYAAHAASARSTWRRRHQTTAAPSGSSVADWERDEAVVMFGVAEDHDSNPIKMGIAK